MNTEKIPFEIYQKSRGSWFGVNPVTKVIDGKKVYTRKSKYPPDYELKDIDY